MAEKTTTVLVLSDDVLKSPRVAETFSKLGLDSHLPTIKETGEISITVGFDTRYPLGPTFRLGNVDFTVPWSYVRAIMSVQEPTREQIASGHSMTFTPSSTGWMS